MKAQGGKLRMARVGWERMTCHGVWAGPDPATRSGTTEITLNSRLPSVPPSASTLTSQLASSSFSKSKMERTAPRRSD